MRNLSLTTLERFSSSGGFDFEPTSPRPNADVLPLPFTKGEDKGEGLIVGPSPRSSPRTRGEEDPHSQKARWHITVLACTPPWEMGRHGFGAQQSR